MDYRFHRNPTYSSSVQVIAIDQNGPDLVNAPGVQTFIDAIGATIDVGLEDASTPTYNAFVASYVGLNPYPVDIVVDRHGVITYVAREYDPTSIQAAVDAALAAP